MRALVYTVVIGDYDYVFPPKNIDDSIDYFIITDDEDLEVDGWDVLLIENRFKNWSASKINRYYKMLPHIFFSGYDVSLYLDGNVRVVGSLTEFFNSFIESDSKIGLLKHPKRKTVKEEIVACLELGKVDNPIQITEEYNKYIKLGFKDSVELTENNVIIRKHNDAGVITSMEFWWACLLDSVGRDQISLPYVREKFKVKETLYDFNSRVKNPFFRIYPHRRKELFYDFGVYFKAQALTSVFFKGVSKVYSVGYYLFSRLFGGV